MSGTKSWYVHQERDGSFSVRCGDGWRVACGIVTAGNARKIAIAPDLFRELQGAVKYCPVPVQDAIRAVLDKAKVS